MIESPPYTQVVIPVDDLEWTKHWLGQRRCDQILVWLARDDQTHPSVVIRAVESKSSSQTDPIPLAKDVSPFDEGVNQVVATLDALADIIDPTESDSLVADLRFASFIEHLASIVLAALHPIEATSLGDVYVTRLISSFSRRELSAANRPMEGMVVCTQYRAAVQKQAILESVTGTAGEWPVCLVRVGAVEVDSVFKTGEPLSITCGPGPAVSPATPPPSAPVAPPEGDNVSDLALADVRQGAPSRQEDPMARKDASDVSANEATVVADDLFLAARNRGFPVSAPRAEAVVIGPSLVAVSMEMEAGSSLRPIEAALPDLAREIGASRIYVSNDPERSFHIRFLVPRATRTFPAVPVNTLLLADAGQETYVPIYVGQTIEGTDFVSYLSTWPHMLIGGTTGGGKTTFLRALLKQLASVPAASVDVAIVDGKAEIDYIKAIDKDHLVSEFPEVLMGYDEAVRVLTWAAEEEIPRRRRILVDLARQSDVPKTAKAMFSQDPRSAEPFPPLVIIIDEFAELMLAGGNSAQGFERKVQQVVQTGRSVMVHLILATQRPDANVISGAIKANLPARVALQLPTHHDSMTVLGGSGAEDLLGRGDLIFQGVGHPPIRLQGYRP